MKRFVLLPSVILGLGIIASTVLALLTSQWGWWVMTGPLLLVLAMVAASEIGRRRFGFSRRPSRLLLIQGGSLILASAIVAVADPFYVAIMLPILGSGATASLLPSLVGKRGADGRCA